MVCKARLDEIEDAISSPATYNEIIFEEKNRGYKDLLKDLLPSQILKAVATEYGKWALCEEMVDCSAPPYQMWPRREVVDKINERFDKK